MSMVEQMARAIVRELARQDGFEDATWILEDGKLPFLDQGEVDMFAVSRAALAAMRTPTPGMVEAGASAPLSMTEDVGFGAAERVWEAMLTAALGEDNHADG